MNLDNYLPIKMTKYVNLTEIKLSQEELFIKILVNFVYLNIKQTREELENSEAIENKRGFFYDWIVDLKNNKPLIILIEVFAIVLILYIGVNLYYAKFRPGNQDKKQTQSGKTLRNKYD